MIAGTVPVAPVPPRSATTPVTPLATPPTPAPGPVGACGSFGRCGTLGVRRRGRSRCAGVSLRFTHSAHVLFYHLELQSAFAGAVGDGLHATMVTITCPVEHDFLDSCRGGLLGQQLAGPFGPAALARAVHLDAFARIAHAQEGHPQLVVDKLGVDVLERPVYHQPRTRGRTVDLAPHPEVPAVAQLLARLGRVNGAHDYFAPVLPALRRTCSPT